MAKSKKNDSINTSVRFMTDDEINARHIVQHKDTFLDDLLNASNNNKSFSVKDLKQFKEQKPESKLTKAKSNEMDPMVPEPEIAPLIDDIEWDLMIEQFDEISPIEDISGEDMLNYRRGSNYNNDNKYENMFKKERSMLNELLNDVQKRSKIVNGRITSMTGKGTYGISKNFIELVEASGSLDNAKLSIIKELVNIKKTQEDMRLKDEKLNPTDSGEEDKDTVADIFYKNMLRGGTRQIREAVTSSMTNVGVDVESDAGFNLTKPIPYEYTTSDPELENTRDKYSYIANENRNVDVCIYRYPDQSVEFVALDEDGEIVEGYELPSESTLDSVEIKPLSNYAYDRYGRKYRIVDIDTRVDISDIDDDKYDTVDSDDKYDYE